MSSITALQLVNRVRLLRRQAPSTAITTPEDVAALNCVNMAAGEILSGKKWEFNVRNDGQLMLRGKKTSFVASNPAPGSDQLIITSATFALTDADVFGDYVVRVQVTGASGTTNTAMRAANATEVTGPGFLSLLNLETGYPEDISDTTYACELSYAEYMLPDTVDSIIRVSYEEKPLNLREVDPTLRYREIFPAPQLDSGEPQIVAVGGYDIPTYDVALAEPEPKLRLAVWPVPDDDYVLTYSYYVRRPELALLTDTISGVPTPIINDIVLKATSLMMMTWDKDYAAMTLGDMADMGSVMKSRTQTGNVARRHTIGSWDSGTRIDGQPEGFPGKVLGP